MKLHMTALVALVSLPAGSALADECFTYRDVFDQQLKAVVSGEGYAAKAIALSGPEPSLRLCDVTMIGDEGVNTLTCDGDDVNFYYSRDTSGDPNAILMIGDTLYLKDCGEN
tara:strand:+ start:781 stop:1116 length:336 start_codon:yes stop_codon:yes gene_type:complete